MKPAQNIDAFIDDLLLHFVSEKSAALCSALIPIAISGLTIYLIHLGLATASGRLHAPAREVLWKIYGISLVLSLALSAGTYQLVIVDGLESIGGAVLQTISGESNFAALLDKLADPYVLLGDKFWADATTGVIPHLGLLFAAAITSLSESVLFSVGLGFYLLAKIALALTMSIGPLFLLCAAWPITQKYAESWLGQTLNYIFLKVLVSVTVVMLTAFVSRYAEHITANIDSTNIIEASCSLLLSALALVIVILFLPHLSSALFGGASVAGIGRAAMHSLLSLLNRPGRPPPRPSNSISGAPPRGSPSPQADHTPLYQRHLQHHIQRPALRSIP